MKRILLSFFITITALLYCTGCSLSSEPVDNKEIEKKQAEETEDTEETTENTEETVTIDAEPQKEDVANAGEWIYSEELGMEYPEFPTEAGFQIAVPDGIELPDDSLLETLSVYEYHEVYEKYAKGFNKKHKARADYLADLLLDSFSPGERWIKKAITQGEDYARGYEYHIKGKEKNRFEYWWYIGNGQPLYSQLLCESGRMPVPEPEDGNWDRAFREFSLSLLDSFEIGLWDGESSHMAVGRTENVSGNNGCYEYRIALDGYLTTGYNSRTFTDEYSPEVSRNVRFRYQDGSLVYMNQWEHQKIFDAKRPLEPLYHSMEEAFDALLKGLHDDLAARPGYYCMKLEKIDIEYIDMIGTYVPILVAHLKMTEFIDGAWRDNEGYACSVQLESGDTVLMDSRPVYWGENLTGE